MKNTCGIVFLLLLSCSMYAQDNHGFYGKKAFVTASSNFYTPLIYNTFSSGGFVVDETGNDMKRGRDKLNIGGNISIGYATSTNFGLALEIGYEKFTVYGNFFNHNNTGPAVLSSENMAVNSVSILPKFEIAGRNGLLPNGLVHQIGIGLTINKAVSKNYFRYYSGFFEGGPNGDASIADQLMEENDLHYSAKLMRLMYGLQMRMPLSKSLMLNYGIRYTLDFGITRDDLGGFFGESKVNYEFYREVRKYQLQSVISLDLGLTLPF